MAAGAVVTDSGMKQITDTIWDCCPQQRSGLRCRCFDNEAVLYDAAHNAVHYLNRTAYFIWTCCDGQHGPDEIVERVMEAFEIGEPAGEPADRVRRDALATLSELAANGLIDCDSRMNHDSARGVRCS